MTNSLLICPTCLERGEKNVLGSVNAYGDIVVLRYRSMTTTIQAPIYTIVCVCGFGTVVKNTANGHTPLDNEHEHDYSHI